MLDFIEGEDENETDYTAEDVALCITSLLEFMSSMEAEAQTCLLYTSPSPRD